MILPDNIIELAISLKDQYFDLKGLAVYSTFAVPTLRGHIRHGGLPCFKVGGKILIKQSEFDSWVESHRVNKKQNLSNIVNGVIESLK